MTERTKIEWCDSTFNPWIGCTRVSPACDHCYAERQDARGIYGGLHWGPGVPRKRTNEANWRKPWQWHKNAHRFTECGDCGWRGEQSGAPFVCAACGGDGRLKVVRRRVFCASLADVFDNEVPAEWRRDLFDLIELTPNLDWLLLTKRIGNVFRMVANARTHDWLAGRRNVWLGISVVNQEEADRDIPKLLDVPAAVKFLSIEPMLGPIDLTRVMRSSADSDWWTYCDNVLTGFRANKCGGRESPENAIDWVIVGGESGPSARPMHPEWVRRLRDQCCAAGTPFLFKQWGEWSPAPQGGTAATLAHDFASGECVFRVGKKLAGRLLDGVQYDGYPETAR